MNDASNFRADATVLAAIPRGFGRDLIEVLYGGWLDDPLWDTYGNLDTANQLGNYLLDDNTERRLYFVVARDVHRVMTIAGAKSRAGTHYRIASAVVGELHGDQTRKCRRCDGDGKRQSPKRAVQVCRACRGSGVVRPSLSTRAEACHCRLPEFRDHLYGVYLTMLSRLRRELDTAISRYRSVAAQLAENA